MRVEVVEGPKFEDFFFRVKVRRELRTLRLSKLSKAACARMLTNGCRKPNGTEETRDTRRLSGLPSMNVPPDWVQKMNDVSYLGVNGLDARRRPPLVRNTGC